MTSANSIEPLMMIPVDDVFPYSYEKQAAIQTIQDEINDIVAEVQWGFFNEVQNSSSFLVRHFQDLVSVVNDLHGPILSDFSQLPKDECRDGAEVLINTTRDQTGFKGANCATRVNNAITSILAGTETLFENFNRQFSEIQQIVVKSFIKNNLFVGMPDDVTRKMDKNYNSNSQGETQNRRCKVGDLPF